MEGNSNSVLTGIDQLDDFYTELKGKSLGLLTNHTGVTKGGQPTVVALTDKGLNVKILYSPEHGISGTIPDATPVENTHEKSMDLPVISLYQRKKIDSSVFDGIDVLLMDIQDIGCRFYTYINTMELAMRLCKYKGVKVLILDRPNPINGVEIQGAFVETNLTSFIGYKKVPVRHGCTAGELLSYYNETFNTRTDIEVIPMRGWERRFYYDETGLPFVPLSPGMPSLLSALLYPSTCLFEGVNVSVGRGTDFPFQWLGAPYIDSEKWIYNLSEINLPGLTIQQKSAIPAINPYSGMVCPGIELIPGKRGQINNFESGLFLLDSLKETFPKNFQWTEYAEIPGSPYIDYLLGTDKFRTGEMGSAELLKKEEEDVLQFRDMISKFLLY